MIGERSEPGRLFPILAVNFIGTLGFSIVLPFLVFLVTRWGGNALVYGIVGATYSAFQLVGAPLLGRWSDLYGRRRILLLSQLGTLASWLVFLAAFFLPERSLLAVDSGIAGGFVLTLPLVALFLARAADGITGGNVSVANAYLADISSQEERSANFGKMAVSSNLGFVLGPAIAGLLAASPWGEMLPVLAAVAISLAASLIIAFKLPESNRRALPSDPEQCKVRKVLGQEHKDCVRRGEPGKLTAAKLFELPGVAVLLAIYFLVMLGFNFFYIGFPIYAVTSLEWSVVDTGIFFSVMSLLMVLVQGPILSRVSRRLPDPVLVIGGSLVLAAGFVFFNASAKPILYLGVSLMALGNGLMWPSVLSILSKAAGESYQGAVQGLAGSTGAVASILGLTVGGVLYGALVGKLFWVSAAATLAVFVVAAASWPVMRRVASG